LVDLFEYMMMHGVTNPKLPEDGHKQFTKTCSSTAWSEIKVQVLCDHIIYCVLLLQHCADVPIKISKQQIL